jgi:phage terminase large subunit-like protein
MSDQFTAENLAMLSPEQKKAVFILVEEQRKRKERRHIDDFFPEAGPLRRELYPKHLAFFKAGTTFRERAIMAANRVGKTEGCTGYEASLHMTGEYPEWWEGRRFDHPVRCWFAGTTAETTRDILQRKLLGPLDNLGTGLIPFNSIVGEPKRDSGIPDGIETFNVRHSSGGLSRGQFKAYKQGRKSFEGDEQDVIVLDEEPPLDVYVECLLRTMTTNGMVILGFTPLEGLSETVLMFMPGGRITEEATSGKFIIGATWEDAPHLTKEAKAELWASIPPHQKDARSKGIPSIGSGAIYPLAEEDVLTDDFKVPEYWPKVYGMDVGWNCTASIWGVWDRETDTVYLTSEYKRGQAEPEVHTKAIKSRGEWVPGVIDPASAGSSQKDGTKLMEEYIELGLDLSAADNTVEAGIFEVYKRLTTGRLKVFRSCTRWLEEFRIYRRDKNGKVVKEGDHLMDCTRYLIMSGLEVAKVKPVGFGRHMSVTQIMDTMPLGLY